ncbi:MAG TPA: LCP family protein [Microbacterium sp.]|uniref:LCP family protein n=1 Tax=Microbacterium sp. TaxID=51671 RepID=UPI002B4757F3|nr:LCP family protein [Microbacterium sp.]HKT55887.1 LCP family protein [Microbacterium sp.]
MTAAALGMSAQPIRHPDGSEQVMTRRGWWLVLLNFLIPGSAQALAGNRRLGRFGLGATLVMWALAIVTVAVALLSRRTMFDLVTNGIVLLVVEVLLVAYAILWVVLTIDTLRLVRVVRLRSWTRVAIPILSVVLLVVASGGAVTAASYAQTARDTFGTLFGASGASQAPSDGYYNIMLLGGDDAQGRTSMRFDSISVVSMNATTGAITTTGVPRDLAGFPFVAGSPMRSLYPSVHTGHGDPVCGWGPGINQLNTEVTVCKHGSSLYPDAVTQGSTPGIEATRDALEGILGVKIQYYVLMNFGGFAQLVDALGGVDIKVTERLPIGGGPKYRGEPASQWAKGWIEPGEQHMDGNTAQWYARSRETTSDWDRVQRQAQLEQAIVKQVNATTLLTRFREVAAAGQNLFKTDIPEGMLGYLADLGIKSRSQKVQAIQLVPTQGVDQFNPDVAAIHAKLQKLLHPAASPSPSN